MNNKVKLITAEVSSSIVSKVVYNYSKSSIKIYFKKKRFRRNKTREFEIPEHHFIKILNSPSIGKAILKLLRVGNRIDQ